MQSEIKRKFRSRLNIYDVLFLRMPMSHLLDSDAQMMANVSKPFMFFLRFFFGTHTKCEKESSSDWSAVYKKKAKQPDKKDDARCECSFRRLHGEFKINQL